MTNREQHARDVLQAAASSRRVDTEALWHGVQSAVGQPSRRTRRNPIVLLAAAAAAAVAGAVIWAGGFGSQQPTPLTSTQAPTATTTPSTSETPSTAPTPSDSTAVIPSFPVKPMLSTEHLLTADDYRAATIPVESVQATEGWGQAPISACQDIPGEGASDTPVVRGEGQRSTEPGQLPAEQYVLGLGTTDAAERLVERILHWPDGCASLGRGGVDEGVITSSPPQSVPLPAGSEGHFYVITFEQGGSTRAERVSVARTGNLVSVVVLHEVGGWQRHFAGDEAELVRRAVARLA